MVTVGSERCRITLDYLTLENFLQSHPRTSQLHAAKCRTRRAKGAAAKRAAASAAAKRAADLAYI